MFSGTCAWSERSLWGVTGGHVTLPSPQFSWFDAAWFWYEEEAFFKPVFLDEQGFTVEEQEQTEVVFTVLFPFWTSQRWERNGGLDVQKRVVYCE